MKTVLIILLIWVVIILILFLSSWDHSIAIVRMDGLGSYRVSNYYIDSKKCIHLIDGTGKIVDFCGSYEVESLMDYYHK